jgi:SEC-C motif-containing protein
VIDDLCPCGTGARYAACCGRFHRHDANATTAEQLMRSRYSAFVLGDAAYLAWSWASSTRPDRIRLDPDQRWVRLEIEATSAGGALANEGTVEFRASWDRAGQLGVLHEVSRFEREDGRWVYVGPAT